MLSLAGSVPAPCERRTYTQKHNPNIFMQWGWELSQQWSSGEFKQIKVCNQNGQKGSTGRLGCFNYTKHLGAHKVRSQRPPKLCPQACSEATQLTTCTWDKKWQSLWNCRSPTLHDPDKNALNEITESAKILCAASSEAAEIATCAFEKWQNLRNCTHVFLQWQFDRIEQHHCSVGARYKISWNHGSVWWTNQSTSLLHSPSIHKLHFVSLDLQSME